jgi:hypothetical protein
VSEKERKKERSGEVKKNEYKVLGRVRGRTTTTEKGRRRRPTIINNNHNCATSSFLIVFLIVCLVDLVVDKIILRESPEQRTKELEVVTRLINKK